MKKLSKQADIYRSVVCPCCLGKLDYDSVRALCKHCQKDYTIKDGILSFVEADDSDNIDYIKDVDFKNLEEFNELNAVILNEDIDKGKQIIKEKFPTFYKYLFEEGRADWRFYLDLEKDSKILDLGCGWGNLSFELAREHGQVTAVDYSTGKLTFLRSRSKASEVHNLELLRADITQKLPFCDNYYDLVVLNGVFEWVGEYKSEKSPREYQEDLLKEINRVLKPDGYIYIGIENRYGYPYFLGRMDDHSRVRFTNLMPRGIANWYMQKKVGREYRTYTYSYNGLKEILSGAGFNRCQVLMPGEDYKYYRHIVPLSQPYMLRYFYKKMYIDSPLIKLAYNILWAICKRNPWWLKSNIQSLVSYFLSTFPREFKYLVPAFGTIARKAN